MSGLLSRRFRAALCLSFALFIFFSPFSIAASQVALGVSLTLFLVLLFLDRTHPFVKSLRWFYFSVALYVGWLFVSAIFGETPMRSIAILKEEWLFLVVPIGVYLFRDKQYLDRLILILGIGLIMLSLYGGIQLWTGVHWFKAYSLETVNPTSYRPAGFFSHPLTFGNYLAVAGLFFLGVASTSFKRLSGWRLVLIIAAGAGASVIAALGNSRGPALAVCIGVLLLGFLLRKVRYALVALLTLLLLIWSTSPGLVQRLQTQYKIDTQLRYEGGRLFIWNHSLKIVRDNPVFGVGQGNFRDEYAKHLRPDIGTHRKYSHAHNDLINTAAIAGIPGLLLFLGVWAVVTRYLWRGLQHKALPSHARSVCLGVLLASGAFWVTSMTEATFADEEVRQLLMFFWGAGLSVWYKDPSVAVNSSLAQTP